MRLAIMQPYFFPYIGYFQLIKAADKFVFLDDVNFINKGWINRNRILLNGEANMFTVPLKNASQNKLIKDILIAEDGWRNKLIKTIEHAYKKASQFNEVFNLLKRIILFSASDISTLAKKSIEEVCSYLDINTSFVDSSSLYKNTNLKAQQRIIDINKKENAKGYVNLIGGTELYQNESFEKEGIELQFIKTKEVIYPQLQNPFVSNLSIIDVLMFNDKKEVQHKLLQFELI